jgi:hypothetical protein
MADINYSPYVNYVRHILSNGDLSGFKTHPAYTPILEHVNAAQGREYLDLIRSKTAIKQEDIQAFCALNDRTGSPRMVSFGNFLASPTSLRYIWHAHTILSWFQTFEKSKTGIDIVEVGGGYGGLCLAVSYFAAQYGVSISSYTIVDIKAPSDLQNLYLSKHALQFPVHFEDGATFGANIQKTGMFLISNYCFSEVAHDVQKSYIDTLFPKVSHGFLAWNMIPVYHFGFDVRIEEETPNTGSFNKFIFF